MIIIYYIRSTIFFIYFVVASLIFGLFLSFALVLPNKTVYVDKIGKIWTKFITEGLKYICGIRWQIMGLENLPKKDGFIVAGKHQSTWETYMINRLFKEMPVYILKKQLLNVPIFGWGMRFASHISIDRKAGIKAIKTMVEQGRFYLNKGHNIVIFPQGTRVPVGYSVKDYPYKTGILSIIRGLKCDVVPMALNSGKFWQKDNF
jgi:1-acyl-sn-glycerol-3-phosphate acyltransferase